MAQCCRSRPQRLTRSPAHGARAYSRTQSLSSSCAATATRALLRQRQRPGGDARADGGTLDRVVLADIRRIRSKRAPVPRRGETCWPIVLRSPKGWTGPQAGRWPPNNKGPEGTFRSHQVPITKPRHARHDASWKGWMRSYRPEELFDEAAEAQSRAARAAAQEVRRMSARQSAPTADSCARSAAARLSSGTR
jgi:hypothetical protein